MLSATLLSEKNDIENNSTEICSVSEDTAREKEKKNRTVLHYDQKKLKRNPHTLYTSFSSTLNPLILYGGST